MHSVPHPYTYPYLLCLFSDTTGYAHNVSHHPNCCFLCWGRTVFFWSKIPCVFLSSEIAITPHRFVKHSQKWDSSAGFQVLSSTSLHERAAQTSSFLLPKDKLSLPDFPGGAAQHLDPHTTSTGAGARHIPGMLPATVSVLPAPDSPPFPEGSPML